MGDTPSAAWTACAATLPAPIPRSPLTTTTIFTSSDVAPPMPAGSMSIDAAPAPAGAAAFNGDRFYKTYRIYKFMYFWVKIMIHLDPYSFGWFMKRLDISA